MKIKEKIKSIYKKMKKFPIDSLLILLGVIGTIAWVFGLDETFISPVVVLYGAFTIFRLSNKVKSL